MKLFSPKRLQNIQNGFTIVELMIATLVFSVILIVITVGVLHFTNAYYRGINSSTTQNTARNVIDIVSKSIQFGKGDLAQSPAVGGPITTYCVANLQFDFVIGNKLDGTAVKNVLYQSPRVTPGGCTSRGSVIAGLSVVNGQELLGKNTRLTQFSVSKLSPSLYKVIVGVAYGDDDLLCTPTLNGSTGGCKATDAAITLALIISHGDSIQCKSQSGSQFCAVSELSTTVQSRIGG